jgi:hypothetical protein
MPAAFGTSTIAGTKYSIYCNFISVNDLTAPVISTFTIPVTSASLVVPVSSFIATDNFGVTGYKLTETAVAPLASDAGWNAVAPTVYTFSSAGTKTLYAWAKDASGNVSAGKTGQVVITLAANDTISVGSTDVYSNIIKWGNQLAMPVTFNEDGKIISITIYHEGGTGNVLLGVYSDQAGFPYARLGITASSVIKSTAGWQTVSLLNPVTVSSGQKVWLSWVFQNSPGMRYTTGTPGRAASSNTWSAGMPAVFGTSTIAGTKYSIYCSYITINQMLKSIETKPENDVKPELLSEIKIYPNPTSGKINININSEIEKTFKLSLFSIQGALIKELLINSGYNEIDAEDLVNGVYLIKIIDNENGAIIKSSLIVKH